MKNLTVLLLVCLAFLPAASAQVPQLVTYHTLLSPSKEVPAVASNNGGDGTIEMQLIRDANGNLTQATVDFRVNYFFAAADTLRAMHIHRGTAAASGPVVIDSVFGSAIPVEGNGSLLRSTTITDAARLAIIEEILANPAGFYLNLHTGSHPGGEFRGQLGNDATAVAFAQIMADLDALSQGGTAQLGDIQAQLDDLKARVRDIGRVLGIR